jgi:cytochrome P450
MSNEKQLPDWDPAERLDLDARMAHMKDMRERCPAAYTERAGGSWGLLRHADIVAATIDPILFSNAGAPRHGRALPPLEVDAPEHREYRRLLTPFFTRPRMQQLEPRVRRFARELSDQTALRADPAALPKAIEELLRFDTPVQAMPRYATQATTLHGRTIEAGERVDMFWASANRDETVFDEPDTCRLDRHPNRHIAFGHGIHLCLGAPMARLELRVALEELLSHTESFEIDGTVQRTPFHRAGVSALPVRWVVRQR